MDAARDPGPTQPGKHDKAIAVGAVVNVLGIMGKLLMPVFFVMTTRLFGPAIMGIYYLVYTIIDTTVTLTVSGFNSGTLMFTSRYADDPAQEDRLYQVLANGFVVSIGICAVLILFAHVGAPQLILSHYPQPGLLDSVQILSWSLPFLAVPIIILAAIKGRLTMKWDAILLGFVSPALMIGLALVAYLAQLGLRGLLAVFFTTQVVITAAALYAFGLYFSYSKLFARIRRFRLFRELISFAIPQNLNMMLNTLTNNMDVMMLGYFGSPPETLMFYGMGSQIARNIRQVKLALSTSFAPVIARLHSAGDRQEMNESYSMVTRWITTIALPLALAVGLLKEDLLLLFHKSFSGDSTFVLVLLLPPLLSCCFGIAGNVVVMTGHSKWNLFNSAMVVALNAAMNLLLIPHYGMMGAAVSAGIAALAITVLQLLEVQILMGARLILARIYKPYVAMALPLAAAALAEIALDLGTSFWLRLATVLACAGLFIAVLARLGIDPRDRAVIAPWSRRRTA